MTTAVPQMAEIENTEVTSTTLQASQPNAYSYESTGSSSSLVAPSNVQANPFSGSVGSLYVGDLLPDVNEAVLFEHFASIGPVSTIRVCRDAVTRRSLGYGYVNYHNAADAERALDMLNYTPIRGKPCRIMKSQRDPSLRKSGSGNVFIKNLDRSVDNKALHDTFSAFGKVLSCKIVNDAQGVSKGFAFVHFENQEAADKAITRINGKMLNGKIVYAGPYQSKKERQSKYDEIKANFTNVFIKNLDPSVDNNEFLKLVSPYGNVTSALIQMDENGNSKGFGFVNYESHSEAEKAIAELNGKVVADRELFASRAQLKAERLDELRRAYEKNREEKLSRFTNLYVKNLDDQIDDEKLRDEFAPFGTIISCIVMRDEKGSSKGFGFVSYENSEDATKAINEMNGKLIFSKPLYVALAQRKEERRAQLEAQYAQKMMRQFAAPMFYPGSMSRPHFPYPVQGMIPRQPRMVPQQQNAMGAPMYPPQVMNPTAANVPGSLRQPRNMRGANIQQMPHANGAYVRNTPRSSVHAGNSRYQPKGNYAPRQEQGTGISAAALAAASPEEQKQMLGERLYLSVKDREPQLAAKITGMLLDMDNGEILHLLESPDALNAKVDEALEVIGYHLQQQSQQ